MTCKLSQLGTGESAIITELAHTKSNETNALGESVARRLMEMGVVVGSRVKILHEAPFGKDPIAIEVRGILIGIRRKEADSILVEKNTEES